MNQAHDLLPIEPPPPRGRIDIHSHLLPGIDDGCEDLEQSLACIGQLKAAGYVGSICTPHVWPELYPANTPDAIAVHTSQLQQMLRDMGVTYQLWPGGELRLFKGVVDWMKEHGVPTLAGSRCVLFDFWQDKWPRWAEQVFQWLFDQGYKPIMAHPERLSANANQPDRLAAYIEMGVRLQGNFLGFTGEDGYQANQLVRQYLTEGRYTFMALDMHQPSSLPSRLDGIKMFIDEFGAQALDQFLIDAPRKLIFDSTPAATEAQAQTPRRS
jgi:protein-tyrosine phosphatase